MDGELGIFLTYGKPGNGKSLDQAAIALELFKDYYHQEKKYPLLSHRAIWSNQKFSVDIELKELNKHLFYWTNPRQLKDLRDVDILWDEIGKDLPGDSWKDTPKWLRQVFSHYRKRGNRIFANTQDYKAVDINVRRMVRRAYKIQKWFGNRDISATLPPVNFIFGILIKHEFDPAYVESLEAARTEKTNEEEQLNWVPHFIFIRKRYVNAYDTKAELPAYMPDKFEHIKITCVEPNCTYQKIEHRKI